MKETLTEESNMLVGTICKLMAISGIKDFEEAIQICNGVVLMLFMHVIKEDAPEGLIAKGRTIGRDDETKRKIFFEYNISSLIEKNEEKGGH